MHTSDVVVTALGQDRTWAEGFLIYGMLKVSRLRDAVFAGV